MAEHVKEFKKKKGSLEEVVETSKGASSQDLNERRAYLGLADNLAQLYGRDLGIDVHVDETTSQAAIDNLYAYATEIRQKKTFDYFKDNKDAIIDELEDKKLAEIIPITAGLDKSKDRKQIKELIQKATNLERKVHAYQHDIPIGENGEKISSDEIGAEAGKYIDTIVKDKKLGNVLKAIAYTTKGGALSIINGAIRRYNEQLNEYLPNNEAKAEYSRAVLKETKEKDAFRPVSLAA